MNKPAAEGFFPAKSLRGAQSPPPPQGPCVPACQEFPCSFSVSPPDENVIGVFCLRVFFPLWWWWCSSTILVQTDNSSTMFCLNKQGYRFQTTMPGSPGNVVLGSKNVIHFSSIFNAEEGLLSRRLPHSWGHLPSICPMEVQDVDLFATKHQSWELLFEGRERIGFHRGCDPVKFYAFPPTHQGYRDNQERRCKWDFSGPQEHGEGLVRTIPEWIDFSGRK